MLARQLTAWQARLDRCGGGGVMSKRDDIEIKRPYAYAHPGV